jgi:hypothetical protein
MAAITSAIASAVTTAASWAVANAGTIAAVGGTYASVKQSEAAGIAAKNQKEAIEQQQDDQKKAIAAANAEALSKRKTLIDRQRKQILGAGDTGYSIGQTGGAGVTGSGMLTGGILG